jgi:hypothetical protein
MSSIVRSFSLTVKKAIQFAWKGTDPVPEYEKALLERIEKIPQLQNVTHAEVQ